MVHIAVGKNKDHKARQQQIPANKEKYLRCCPPVTTVVKRWIKKIQKRYNEDERAAPLLCMSYQKKPPPKNRHAYRLWKPRKKKNRLSNPNSEAVSRRIFIRT